MNSQTLVIGDDDTSNDFSVDDKRDEDYVETMSIGSNHSRNIQINRQINDEHELNSFERLEAERVHAYLNDLQPLPPGERPEDDDTWIDRLVRIDREEALNTNGSSSRRLVAPSHEINKRQPRKAKANRNDDEMVNQLRAKQLELVNIQINVQKTMHESAKIAQKEAIERLQLARIQRTIAENDLQQHK